MKPHRRQFVVTRTERPQQLSTLPSFRTRRLGENVFLHHDDELIVDEKDGELILGRMIRPGDGRYVRIVDGKLSLDASGSLGVQYCPDGPTICSSSPTLLGRFSGRPTSQPQSSVKLTWLPAPRGAIEGSRRLMFDQVLDLRTREVGFARRHRAGPVTLEAAAEGLAREAIESARALGATGRPLYVALTAGQDSRTIFSAFVAAGVSFKAFTLLLSDGASHKDARVAAAICARHGIEHIQVKGLAEGSGERRKLYLEHTNGVDGDRGCEYAEGNYYRDLPDGAIVAHGGALGLSKRAFEYMFSELPDLKRTTVIAAINKEFGPLSSDNLNALGEWYDYRESHPFSTIGDHFFIDQRRASWGADNRFAEDVFGFEWFVFANTWPLIDTFLSAPAEARDGLLVQKRAIDLMTPGLNAAVPNVNPPMTPLERWKGRLSRRGLQKLSRLFKAR